MCRLEYKINCMEYIAALSLLVAVAAWIAAAYTRLRHLYANVQHAWVRWNAATQQRNACLGDFTAVFASFLTQEDMLPRDMRRWTEDSQRALEAMGTAPPIGSAPLLADAERKLQRMIRYSAYTLETTPKMKESEQLLGLYHAMSVSRNLQAEVGKNYNRRVRDYNAAINEPLTRLFAPVLGFKAVAEVSSYIPPSNN